VTIFLSFSVITMGFLAVWLARLKQKMRVCSMMTLRKKGSLSCNYSSLKFFRNFSGWL
jgi:hypothetical protein